VSSLKALKKIEILKGIFFLARLPEIQIEPRWLREKSNYRWGPGRKVNINLGYLKGD
jgi:hypothetical protein